MTTKDRVFQIAAHGVLCLLALFCLLPFLLLLSSSVTAENSLIRYGYSFFPREIDLAAYRYLLVDSGSIVRGYLISALATVCGTVLNMLLTKTEMLKQASSAGASMGPLPTVGIKMAVAVLGALLVLAVYPFFQRYFIKGIAIGAVKG